MLRCTIYLTAVLLAAVPARAQDAQNETKDYFERLTLELRKTCPNLKKPVLMVPVGHVMYELNQRIKAGEVPGHKEIGSWRVM